VNSYVCRNASRFLFASFPGIKIPFATGCNLGKFNIIGLIRRVLLNLLLQL
jgi:hypothetical protein